MSAEKWDRKEIETSSGKVEGVVPEIISASRSTDIPAFYSEWFFNRLQQGYMKWINPFNGKPQYVSFDKTLVIVFWTKDPAPIIPYLNVLEKKNINYYFSFTLNDYEKEGLEPGTRKIEDRIDAFKELSRKIGKENVIWRFDPLILTEQISVDNLIEKIKSVGDEIADYTDKLVISFANIAAYKKVRNNLDRNGVNYKEFEKESMLNAASKIEKINRKWGLEVATCSEEINLSEYNIKENKCIDDELMVKNFSHNKDLMKFLGYDEQLTLFDYKNAGKSNKLKDKGQRKGCGCIISKDIGQYNTCRHLCLYCYANISPDVVNKNYQMYLNSRKDTESIV